MSKKPEFDLKIEKSIRDSIEQETEENLYKQTFDSILKKGIPNAFLIADYYLAIMIIKNSLIQTQKTQLLAASAYFTSFLCILVHLTNLSMMDFQGNLGSKHFGAKKYNYVCLRFKQSVVISLGIFLLIAVIPSFFFSNFLKNVLGVEENISKSAQMMVIWSLPAMAVRNVNDCLKTFIQNNELDSTLGYFYSGIHVLLIPLSIFVINFLGFEEVGIGILLIFFELSGLLLGLYFIYPIYKTEKFDFSLPLYLDIITAFKDFLDFFIIEAPLSTILEFQNFIVYLIGIDEHLVVYTLWSTFNFFCFTTALGFCVEQRTIINQAIGQKNLRKSLLLKPIFKKIYIIIAVVFSLGLFCLIFALEKLGIYGGEGTELRNLTWMLKYHCSINAFLNILWDSKLTILKSTSLVTNGVYVSTFPYVLTNLSAFVIGVYFGYGVNGVICMENLCMIGVILALGIIVKMKHVKEFLVSYFDELKIGFEDDSGNGETRRD